jgi:hypothetical protein
MFSWMGDYHENTIDLDDMRGSGFLPATVLAYEDLKTIVLPIVDCKTDKKTGGCTAETKGEICSRDRKTCTATNTGCSCR